MDTYPGLHEHISALADGELAASELELAFAALDTDAGRQAWHAYRQIGEALRAGQDALALSAGFDARPGQPPGCEAVPAAASWRRSRPRCPALPLSRGVGAVPQR